MGQSVPLKMENIQILFTLTSWDLNFLGHAYLIFSSYSELGPNEYKKLSIVLEQ